MRYWKILLQKQRERGNDGLTLPFLLGSQKYLPKEDAVDDIEDIILDMVSSKAFETCVRYCMGTQTIIFEIRKLGNSVYYPTYKGEVQNNLSVSTFLRSDLGNTIEELIRNLIEEFQDKIDNQKYSAEPNVNDRNPNWRSFSILNDVPFIEESFKLL